MAVRRFNKKAFLKLLKNKQFDELRNTIALTDPADLADIFEELGSEDVQAVPHRHGDGCRGRSDPSEPGETERCLEGEGPPSAGGDVQGRGSNDAGHAGQEGLAGSFHPPSAAHAHSPRPPFSASIRRR